LAKEILTSGITPDTATVWDQGFSESFLNGKIAMIMAGAADDFELREMNGFTKDDLAYGLVPSGVDGKHHSFNWTASTVMNAKTKNPEMAYKAMEAMTLKFFGWKVTPPIKNGIDMIDTMLEGTKIKSKDTIVAALEDTRGGNYHTSYGEINVWGNLFEPLLLTPNEFNPSEVVVDLEKKINDILNR
jgi:multiple sugar transport system substrate-binding protein